LTPHGIEWVPLDVDDVAVDFLMTIKIHMITTPV